MQKLKLPIGIESYKEVIKNCYHVNKTEIIAKICDFPKESVLLFTRPPRFGKSLTLSMIDTFFNMKEKDAESYFKNTKIYKNKDVMSRLSSLPVIHLDMKEVVGSSLEEMTSLLARQIAEAFMTFSELEKSPLLSENDRLFVKNALAKKLNKADLMLSLNTLTRLIFTHFSLCPIILIDEYDAPLQNVFDNSFYSEASAIFKPFYSSALKGNNYLQFAILTGVMQIAKESMFSGLNNIIINSVLDSSFDEYFGFNDKEVEKLLSAYNLDNRLTKQKNGTMAIVLEKRTFIISGLYYVSLLMAEKKKNIGK